MRNDSASVAGIILFFVAIIFLGFFWIVFGSFMDGTTAITNNLTDADGSQMYMSPERAESMAMLQGAYGVFPLLAIVILVVALIIVAFRDKNSTV